MSEFELIGRIAAQVPAAPRVEVGIGDDAAVVRGRGRVVTSVDTAVAGVHFQSGRPAAESAWKAVASAVSDLAAMGLGTGLEADLLVALGAPRDTPSDYLDELAGGVIEAAAEFGVDLIGGDVVAAPAVFLSVTAIAHVDAEAPLTKRSGARPGDLVAVTGPVGGAAAGLRLLEGLEVPGLSELSRDLLIECQVRPRPELAAAPVLAREGATAMIDVSDGLAQDLAHVCKASRVAIRVDAEAVPIAAGADEVARATGTDPQSFAISGGEDYVLAATIPPERFATADTALIEATGFELLAIGEVLPSEAGDPPEAPQFRRSDGTGVLSAGGHDHFR